MLPKGTFVIFGVEQAPEVRALTAGQFDVYMQAMSLSWKWKNGAADGVASVFGLGFDHAIPAWVKAPLELMATQYEGAYRDNVRAVCAAIALGMPFQTLREGAAARARRKPEGDGNARLVPPQPVMPSPAAAVSP